MKIKINKQLILENNQSKFMKGVNHGFHDSLLPTQAVKSYSDPSQIKPKVRQSEQAIGQDLGLRLGTMAASKATIGAAAYGGIEGLKNLVMDDPSELDQAFSVVPAIATSWIASDTFSKNIPKAHRKVFGNKSIYKGN